MAAAAAEAEAARQKRLRRDAEVRVRELQKARAVRVRQRRCVHTYVCACACNAGEQCPWSQVGALGSAEARFCLCGAPQQQASASIVKRCCCCCCCCCLHASRGPASSAYGKWHGWCVPHPAQSTHKREPVCPPSSLLECCARACGGERNVPNALTACGHRGHVGVAAWPCESRLHARP